MAQINQEQLSELLTGAVSTGLMNTSNLKIAPYNGLYDVDRWLNDFEDVSDAIGWDDATRISKLPAYLTGVARDWYSLYLKDNRAAKATWNACKAFIREHFLDTDHETHLLTKLRTRKQGIYEKVANYIFTMEKVCKDVNVNMSEKEKIQHILHGLLPPIKEKILLFNPTTLATLLSKAKEIEMSLRSGQDSGNDPVDSQQLTALALPESTVINEPSNSEILTAIKHLGEIVKSLAETFKDETQHATYDNAGQCNSSFYANGFM